LAFATGQRADRLLHVSQVDAHVEQLLLGGPLHEGDVHAEALAQIHKRP
jgi:hypothetical protein